MVEESMTASRLIPVSFRSALRCKMVILISRTRLILINLANSTLVHSDKFEIVSDVTLILERAQAGDPQAANELLPLVYDELRRLAAARLLASASTTLAEVHYVNVN